MAAPTRRVVTLTALAALVVWAWALALTLGVWRWNSVIRVGPPAHALFPYGELRVAIDPGNPPFAYPDGDAFTGIEPDLARAIGARLGVPVRLIPHGFDGLYDAVRADQADLALAALVINPTRTGDVRYTAPYFNAGQVLVVNGTVAPDSPANGLFGRVAVAYGTDEQTQAERWLRLVEPFEIRTYETRDFALDALRLGDTDAALVDAVSFGRYQAAHPAWQGASLPMTVVPYAGAMRHDRAALGNVIERALTEIMADGTLQGILDRYLSAVTGDGD